MTARNGNGSEEVYRLSQDCQEAGSHRDYQNFDLHSVSWGYRRIFARAIEGLFADGAIGPDRERSTRVFFDMLKRSQPGSFDFALKEFLGALSSQTKWMLELPGVFEDFCQLGCELAEEKLAHGIQFFRLWGQGGFGDRPEHVQNLLTYVRALGQIDAELAQAFMIGYGRLLDYLDSTEIGLFVAELRDLYNRNPRTAADFAALRVKSAMTYVRSLTQEARLDQLRDRLARLSLAVLGRNLRIGDLSELDSDHVIMRNTKLVCFADSLYLPRKIRVRDSQAENEALYLLAVIASATALRSGSFSAIHGEAGAVDVTNWLGGDPAAATLLTLIEIVRIVEQLRREAPGLRRLLRLAVELEFSIQPPRTFADALLRQCLKPAGGADELVAKIRDLAVKSRSCQDSRRLMAPLLGRFRRAADSNIRSLLFFPDFYYPAERDVLPASKLVADLNKENRRDAGDERPPRSDSPDKQAAESEEDQAGAVEAAFIYPEWNHTDNDYYEDWCLLREEAPRPGRHFRPMADPEEQQAIARARRMFERLKPELAHKEKFLEHGDEINVDRLVEHIATKHRLPGRRVRFYEKTFIKKRDFAVAVLLDVSGSTAGPPVPQNGNTAAAIGQKRIIDLEKHAAMTLGEGLEALGDPFGIYGFSGNGREQCKFFIYKGLDEPFTSAAKRRLMAAHPIASTRIGVALRHCRTKLENHPARRKIIILITDGKPEDTGYDPATRYAQYDVRMACHECERDDIHVVCISTLENTRSDMEIMFPRRRFTILPHIQELPRVLPKLYIKLTI